MLRNGSRDKIDSTKKQILRAARKLFSQYGYEATTTRMITDHVGVSQSAISFHYDSKEKLCKAVAEYTAELIEAAYAPVYADIDRAFSAGPVARQEADDLASRLLYRQITFVFDPRNQHTVNLLLRDRTFPSVAQGIIPAALLVKVENQLARLLPVCCGGGTEIWAKAVSRALDGSIFAFLDSPALLKEMRSSSDDGSRKTPEGYVLDFLMSAVRNCPVPNQAMNDRP